MAIEEAAQNQEITATPEIVSSQPKYLIGRHGQNLDNENTPEHKPRLNGRRDLPLTELGRQQARETGEKLKAMGYKPDVLWVSPLGRAKETAMIIAQIIGLDESQIKVEEDLTERSFGIYTGRLAEEIPEIAKEHGDELIKTGAVTYFNQIGSEYGETFEKCYERAVKLYKKMISEDQKVFLVGHGDMGKMLVAAAYGLTWREALEMDFHFGNADVIKLPEKIPEKGTKVEYYGGKNSKDIKES